MEDKKLPTYIDVDGFRLPGAFFPKAFQDSLQYKPRDDDVFIVTYPKCGTTWMQYIVYLIYNRGECPNSYAEFYKFSPFMCLSGVESVSKMARPGTFKMHLPFHLQPYSPKTKYIYVTRNPKDCCTSFYFFTRGNFIYHFFDGTFDDYFELFMEGKTDFGDYFDSVLSWYEHRNDPNVLFLMYEDMKKDLGESVRKVVGFLGEEYAKMLETDPSMMEKIVQCSSFEFMKKNFDECSKTETPEMWKQVATPGLIHFFSQTAGRANENHLMRKGINGGWRSVFSVEQSRRMDAKIEEKLAGTDLLKFWKVNNYL